jgi:hypothetical protein
MTKKHFKAIAEIIKGSMESRPYTGNSINKAVIIHTEGIAECLSHYFQQENPQFDRDRFLKACGIE